MVERMVEGDETGAYSGSVVCEGRLGFISGRGPMRDGVFVSGTIEEETRLTLECLVAAVERIGGSKRSIVRCGCFLADLADWPRFDAEYRAFFGEAFPARTTIGAALGAGIKVEIDAVVALDTS